MTTPERIEALQAIREAEAEAIKLAEMYAKKPSQYLDNLCNVQVSTMNRITKQVLTKNK